MIKRFIRIFLAISLSFQCSTALLGNSYKFNAEKMPLYQVLSDVKSFIAHSGNPEESRVALQRVDEEVLLFKEIVALINKGNFSDIYFMSRLISRFTSICNFFRKYDYPEPHHLRTFREKVESFDKFIQKYFTAHRSSLTADEITLCNKLIKFDENLISNFLKYEYFEIDIFDRIADWSFYRPVEGAKAHPYIATAVILTVIVAVGLCVWKLRPKQPARNPGGGRIGLDLGDFELDEPGEDGVELFREYSQEIQQQAAELIKKVEFKDSTAQAEANANIDFVDGIVPHQLSGGSCGINAVFNAAHIEDNGQITLENEQHRAEFFKKSAARYKAGDLVNAEAQILGRLDFAVQQQRMKVYETSIYENLSDPEITQFFETQKEGLQRRIAQLQQNSATTAGQEHRPTAEASPEKKGFLGTLFSWIFASITTEQSSARGCSEIDSLKAKLQKLEEFKVAVHRKLIEYNPNTQKTAEDLLYYLEGGQLKMVNREYQHVHVESDLARFTMSLASQKVALVRLKEAICSILDPEKTKLHSQATGKTIVDAIREYTVDQTVIVYPSAAGWRFCAEVWKLIINSKIQQNLAAWQAIAVNDTQLIEKFKQDVFSDADLLKRIVKCQAQDIETSNPVEATGTSLAKLRVDLWTEDNIVVRIVVPMRGKGGNVGDEVMTHWLGYRITRQGNQIKVICADSMGRNPTNKDAKYPSNATADCTKLVENFFSHRPSDKEVLQVKIALKNEEIARAPEQGNNAQALQEELMNLTVQLSAQV